jgi:hypothetical protein
MHPPNENFPQIPPPPPPLFFVRVYIKKNTKDAKKRKLVIYEVTMWGKHENIKEMKKKMFFLRFARIKL